MILVAPPRTKAIEPGGRLVVLAHVPLDRRADEDPVHTFVVSRGSKQPRLRLVPVRPQTLAPNDETGCGESFAFRFGRMSCEGREPHVDVESVLVAGMSRQHRATARRSHVTNEQSRSECRSRRCSEICDVGDKGWVTVESVARRTHHRITVTVERQRLGALQTTGGIKTHRRGGTSQRLPYLRPFREQHAPLAA
jgi:hypothetical protein